MASLRDIRRRIRSVENTKQITRAMEMVSAAKLRRAQSRVVAARPYAAKLQEILENLAGVARNLHHPLFEPRTEEKEVALILVTASKGLCGNYNSALIRRAEVFLRERPHGSVKLITVGRRGHDYFARRGYPIISYYPDVNDFVTFGPASHVAGAAIRHFVAGEVDAVYLLYTRFISAMTRAIALEKFLNIEPPEAAGGPALDYIFEPDPESILNVLPERYAAVKLMTAFMEASASEHGARMIAMGSASRNASELIGDLVLQRNRARQAAITKEISEIVGGAEALK
jgi:F-type H+-transporting ATPase subunit gamma